MPLFAPKSAAQPSGRRRVLALIFATVVVVVAVMAGTFVGRHMNDGSGIAELSVVHFSTGQRLSYRVDFESTSATNLGALFSDAQSQSASPFGLSHVFQASMKGDLVVTVLDVDADHVSVVYEFQNPLVHFHSEGMDEPNQSQIIQTGLARPVFCLLDRSGSVQSVWFDTAANLAAQRLSCTLLAAMQVVRRDPSANSVTQWDAEEQDPNGTLIAHYEALSDGTIRKTKPRYLQPKPAKKSKTIRLIPTIQSDGQYVATLDADHNLTALSVSDVQSITMQNKVVGNGILKLEMNLLRKEEAPSSELSRLRVASADRVATARAVKLYDPTSPEQADVNIQRQELGTATLESLLADLATAETGSPQENDSTQLFLKFKALAFIRPESCARLGELLSQAKTGSLRMQVLSDALESAGNAQAQAALSVAVLSHIDDWNATQVLLPALGDVESPTPQTVDTLLALAFGKYDHNVKTTARLALGNAARSLGDDSPVRAKKIVDRLLEELKNATATESWELLLALGNAGLVETLPTLKHYLDDPAPNLRGGAAWALRWIDSPQVDDLLTIKVLAEEQDVVVRLEAIRALRIREKTPQNIAAQKKAFAKESDPQARIELLSNLWDARETDPEVKPVVEKAAANDPVEAVREAAAKMMESPQPVQ